MKKIALQSMCSVLAFASGLLCSIANAQTQADFQTASKIAQPASTQIFYTGDLFGYLRWPDLQTDSDTQCPESDDRASQPARQFVSATPLGQKMILVGVGDNFAPDLFARIVDSKQDGKKESKTEMLWDYMSKDPGWLNNAEVDQPKHQALRNDIAKGNGRVGMDNVACFLSRAGYAAIVPGKHDFHFGPEYLRGIARFLATNNHPPFHAVQMLAANVVIQTTVDNAAKRIPYRDKEPAPAYSDDKANLIFQDLATGDGVLPWLRHIKIQNVPTNGHVRLCEIQDDPGRARDPDRLPSDISSCPALPFDDAKNAYQFTDQGDVTLLTGDRSYWLCVDGMHRPKPNQKWDDRPYCQRFDVSSPFFMYPNQIPKAGTKEWPRRDRTLKGESTTDGGYLDPKPYVLIEPKDPNSGSAVAIFGVVDPNLAERIGILNEEWVTVDQNDKLIKNHTTKAVITDPVVALRQVLQYFEDDYALTHKESPQFHGIKVLLAQMPNYEAERIGIVMKGVFSTIIAQAQREYATPQGSQTISVPSDTQADDAGTTLVSWPSPTFLVAPVPFYDGLINPKPKLQIASFAVRRNNICLTDPCEEQWALDNQRRRLDLANPANSVELLAPPFSEVVNGAISATEHATAIPGKPLDQLTYLTLELMRQAMHSDIAMLQERDIYQTRVPKPPTEEDLQQALDRVFWKEDFMIRVLVRGDVLKSVMARSKSFDEQDKMFLSLDQEKKRGLVTLGILSDSVSGQYFIHGVALDPAKMYSVAVSDYVGMGDTGYSDLLTPPVGNPIKPLDFPELQTISGLVCEHIRENIAAFSQATCDKPVTTEAYFDELSQLPFDTTKGLTPGQHFRTWARFQKRRPSLYKGQTPLESAVQQAPLWSISLSKLSLGFTMNQHNNGTEANLASLFAGIPNAQVNAPNTNTVAIESSARFQRDARGEAVFGQVDGSYTRQLTRQNDATNSDLEAQLKNLLTLESGIMPRLYPKSKESPDLKVLLSGRLETQFAPPLTTFKLNTSPTTLLKQDTNRTKTLLAKIGLRFDNDKSFGEAGYEIGGVFGSPLSFTFNPGTTNAVTCTAIEAEQKNGLASCVKTNSTPPNGLILPTSPFQANTRLLFQNGLFLNFKLNVPLPLNNSLSYTMESKGQFFFNHRGNASVDTKFQEDWIHSLTVPLFGNFSFVPKLEIFFFQNKVENHFFYALQPSVTLQYNFAWHDGLPWGKTLLYQTPSSGTGGSPTAK